MKKVLTLLLVLGLAVTARAEQLTLDTTAVFSRSWVNNSFLTLYNRANSGWETDNLAQGAVTSNDIATHANPLTRENELIGEMVYSGGVIAAAAGLSYTTTACVAYITNDGDGTLHRVSVGATAHTYTASRDTWVYLDYTGNYSYNTQLNGAAQPATPINSIIIAKVVTDATDITSVVDHRQLTPSNLRIYLDYKSGLTVSRDSVSPTTIKIGRGEIDLGTTGKTRRNTTEKSLNFSTSGADGLDAGALAGGTMYYIFAYPDADSATYFDTIASLSSSDATGVTDERLIGWAYSQSASAISSYSVGTYKGRGGDAPNVVRTSSVVQDSTTSTTWVDVPGMQTKFYSSGRPVTIHFKANAIGSNNSYVPRFILEVDGTLLNETESAAASANNITDPWTLFPTANTQWTGVLQEGEHYIKPKYRITAGGNTGYVISREIMVAEW